MIDRGILRGYQIPRIGNLEFERQEARGKRQEVQRRQGVLPFLSIKGVMVALLTECSGRMSKHVLVISTIP